MTQEHLQDITLILGDCMDYMQTLPDNTFDLAICDIPYGIGVGNMSYLKEKSTTVKQKNGIRLNGNRNKKAYTQKDWDNEAPDQKYFDELRRISKNQIIFGVEYVDWQGLGSGRIKWIKGVAQGMSFKPYELAYCSMIDHEVELPLLWSGMCQAKSLSEPMTQQGNKKLNEKRIHPTQKPVLIYKRLLIDYAKPGFKIIDTHLGSGSNAVASYDGGFEFTGIELDSEYYESAKKRIQYHQKQTQLF